MRVAVLTRPESGAATLEAGEVADCLRALGHAPVPVECSDIPVTEALLERFSPQLVFNLVDRTSTGRGTAHEVATMMDALDLPHTGAPAAALEALADRREAKAQMRQAGLPVPEGIAPWDNRRRFAVKPAYAGLARDLGQEMRVVGAEAARALVEKRERETGTPWFAESYIEGRSFCVPMIELRKGPMVLPIAETIIIASLDGTGSSVSATQRIFGTHDGALVRQLGELAMQTWRLFGLRGYASVDFRVDSAGHAVIVDVEALPRLNASGEFCAAAAQLGMEQVDVVGRIVSAALVRKRT